MEEYYKWYDEIILNDIGSKVHRMEPSYLPHYNNIVDAKSIAFIVNPTDQLSDILQYDFYRNNENTDTMSEIVTSTCYEFKEKTGESLSAILAGIPSSGISGILVTQKLAQDTEFMNNLKSIFPNCYIALAGDGTILYMPSDINITEYNENQ